MPEHPFAQIATDGLQRVLGHLAEGIRQERFRAVLFGGFALPVYGVERLTLDIDFMIADTTLSPFAAWLAQVGYAQALRTPQYAKFRHPQREVYDIDTVFVDQPSFDRIWAMASWHAISNTSLPVASLDILLGTKLHALRYNEGQRTKDDLGDVVNLLVHNQIDPNGQRFAAICAKYGTPELHRRICQRLPTSP